MSVLPPGVTQPVWELEVDPILCRAHGMCAELVPEVVDLDEWGYPIVHGPVPGLAHVHARSAVRACPTLALRLTRRDRA